MTTPPNVVPFPALPPEDASSFGALWGKRIQKHGYAAIPAIMVRAQHRLGVNPTQFCILVQLLEYWRTRDRAPFPTKQQLADRIGVSQSTIQQNMRELEKAGLVKRVKHSTASGDWGANTYHLDGRSAWGHRARIRSGEDPAASGAASHRNPKGEAESAGVGQKQITPAACQRQRRYRSLQERI